MAVEKNSVEQPKDTAPSEERSTVWCNVWCNEATEK